MTDPAFEAGARDIRAKRGFPADFDTWPTNTAWNYEQGRARAQRVSASVALKRDGRVTVEARALVHASTKTSCDRRGAQIFKGMS
jgi:hypothetical protein